jgi:hypothetical protein
LYPSVTYTNADINMEEAWDVMQGQAGKPFVKGGVFDTGLNWQHQDFGYDGLNPGSSRIIGGWDMETNTALKTIPGGGDGWNHGTGVAGIIGAMRNNTLGIAGIAGGNYSLSPKPGVSLYGLRIMTTSNQGIPTESVAKAVRNASILDTSQNYAYGLHFMNHSYGISTDSTNGNSFTDTNITLLTEVVHFANRQKVTVVASRGNWSASSTNELNIPACIDDDWVLNVGASGTDGQYMHHFNWFNPGPVNAESSTWWGYGLDVSAPGTRSLITTLYNNTTGYHNFNGTSASAPQVAGVVGLLMSYMNDTTNSYRNLAPEDCEFIIQQSATLADSAGRPNMWSGWGRLNAGKALKMVEKPYYALYHFGMDPNANCSYNISKSVYNNFDTVVLTERYQNKAFPRVWFKKGKYLVKTYQVNATISHNLGFITDSLMYYWPRPSSSEVLELYTGPAKKLRPRERVKINSCNASFATLTGYMYEVKDLAGNPLGWWPCDTSFSSPYIKSLFEYSILVKNKAVGIYENHRKIGDQVQLYPNPADRQQTLIIETGNVKQLSVELYDLMGRQLRTVFNGKATGERTAITVDIANLPPSVYLYKIKLDGDVVTKRFIKQ